MKIKLIKTYGMHQSEAVLREILKVKQKPKFKKEKKNFK